MISSKIRSNLVGNHTFEVTEANFETEVLKSDTPVLVDFWAEWCAPCKLLTPVVEAIAAEYGGKLRVGKLDADAYPEISVAYNIMGLPTLILFKKGEDVMRISGGSANPNKENLINKITPHLS
jgi:thioredoxin 1